eukprot:scaffold56688_cov69-Cyclotella_meneghiniana.AAC.7
MKSVIASVFIAVAAVDPTAAFTSNTARVSLTASSTSLQAEATRRTMLSNSLTGLLTLAAPINAMALETYLTEPTDEFKESERQRMEFRKKQLAKKSEFVKVLAHLTTEASTPDELEADLKSLRLLVLETGGLPLGIKKEDMYKVIRGRKAKGPWPTDVEIAYQKLKAEVAYQQSPNTEKDLENPL